MRPLRFTRHLRERMALRGVTEAQVRATVADPDATRDTPQQSREFRKSFGDRTLKVWVVWPPSGGSMVVKSTAWKGESDA